MATREQIEIILDTDVSSVSDSLKKLDQLEKKLSQLQRTIAEQIRARTGKDPSAIRRRDQLDKDTRELLRSYKEIERTVSRLKDIKVPIHPEVDRNKVEKIVGNLKNKLEKSGIKVPIEPVFSESAAKFEQAISRATKIVAGREPTGRFKFDPDAISGKAIQDFNKRLNKYIDNLVSKIGYSLTSEASGASSRAVRESIQKSLRRITDKFLRDMQYAGMSKEDVAAARSSLKQLRKNIIDSIYPQMFMSPQTGGYNVFEAIARNIRGSNLLRHFPGLRDTSALSGRLLKKVSIEDFIGASKALDIDKLVNRIFRKYAAELKEAETIGELPLGQMKADLRALSKGIGARLGLHPDVVKRAAEDAEKHMMSLLGAGKFRALSPEIEAQQELNRLLHEAVAARLAPNPRQAAKIARALAMAESTGDKTYFEKAMTLIDEGERAKRAAEIKNRIQQMREMSKGVRTKGIVISPQAEERIQSEYRRIIAETGDEKLAERFRKAASRYEAARQSIIDKQAQKVARSQQDHMKKFYEAAADFRDKFTAGELDRLAKQTRGMTQKQMHSFLERQLRSEAEKRLGDMKEYLRTLRKEEDAAELLRRHQITPTMLGKVTRALREAERSGDKDAVSKAMQSIDELSRKIAAVGAEIDINKIKQSAQAHEDLAKSIDLNNVALRNNIQNKINKAAADIFERTRNRELADEYKKQAERLEKLNQVENDRARARERIKYLKAYVGDEPVPEGAKLTKRQEARIRAEADRIRRLTQSDELGKEYERLARRAAMLDVGSRGGGGGGPGKRINDIIAQKQHEALFYQLAMPYAGKISRGEMHRLAVQTFGLPPDSIVEALRVSTIASERRAAFDTQDLREKVTRDIQLNMQELMRKPIMAFNASMAQGLRVPHAFSAAEIARIDQIMRSVEYTSPEDTARARSMAEASVLSRRMNHLFDRLHQVYSGMMSRIDERGVAASLQKIFPGAFAEVANAISSLEQMDETVKRLEELSKTQHGQEILKKAGVDIDRIRRSVEMARTNLGTGMTGYIAWQTEDMLKKEVAALKERRDVYRFMEAVGAKAYEYPTFSILERAYKQIEFLRMFTPGARRTGRHIPLSVERREDLQKAAREVSELLGVNVSLFPSTGDQTRPWVVDPKDLEEAEKRLEEAIKAQREIRKVEERYKRLDISMSDLTIYMGRVGVLLKVFDAVRASIAHTKEAIWDFNVALRDSAVNISQTTLAVSRFVDTNKQYLPVGDQVKIAADRASVFMKMLRQASIEARVPIEALVEGFKVSAGVAAQAGATMDQTVDIVTGLVALAQTLGIPISNLAKTIDNIFTGQRAGQVTLARMLGLSEGEIVRMREAGELGQQLAERLMPVIEAQKKLGDVSFTVQFSRFMNVFRDAISGAGQTFVSSMTENIASLSTYMEKVTTKMRTLDVLEGFRAKLIERGEQQSPFGVSARQKELLLRYMPQRGDRTERILRSVLDVVEWTFLILPFVSALFPATGVVAGMGQRVLPFMKYIGRFDRVRNVLDKMWTAIYNNWITAYMPPRLEKIFVDWIIRGPIKFGRAIGGTWWRYGVSNFLINFLDKFGFDFIANALRGQALANLSQEDLQTILADPVARDVLRAMAGGDMSRIDKRTMLHRMAGRKVKGINVRGYQILRPIERRDVIEETVERFPAIPVYAGVAASIKEYSSQLIMAYANLESKRGDVQAFIESIGSIYRIAGDMAQAKDILRQVAGIKPGTTSKEFYEALTRMGFKQEDIERIKEAEEIFTKVNRAFNIPFIEEIANLAQDIVKFSTMTFYRAKQSRLQLEKFESSMAYERGLIGAGEYLDTIVEIARESARFSAFEETYDMRQRLRMLKKALADKDFEQLTPADMEEFIAFITKQEEILSAAPDLERIRKIEQEKGNAAAVAAIEQEMKARERLREYFASGRMAAERLRDALMEGREGLRVSADDLRLLQEIEKAFNDYITSRENTEATAAASATREQIRRMELQRQIRNFTFSAQTAAFNIMQFFQDFNVMIEENIMRPHELRNLSFNRYLSQFKKIREEFIRRRDAEINALFLSLQNQAIPEHLIEAKVREKATELDNEWRNVVRQMVSGVIGAINVASSIILSRIERDAVQQATAMIPRISAVQIAERLSIVNKEALIEQAQRAMVFGSVPVGTVDERIVEMLRNEQDQRIAQKLLEQENLRNEITRLQREAEEKRRTRARILQIPMQMFDLTVPEMQSLIEGLYQTLGEGTLYASQKEGLLAQYESVERRILDGQTVEKAAEEMARRLLVASEVSADTINTILNSSFPGLPENSEYFRYLHYAINQRIVDVMSEFGLVLDDAFRRISLGNAGDNVRKTIAEAIKHYSSIVDTLAQHAERMQFDNVTSSQYLGGLQMLSNFFAEMQHVIETKPLDEQQLTQWSEQFNRSLLFLNYVRDAIDKSMPGGSSGATVQQIRELLAQIEEARKTPRTVQQQQELERLNNELVRITQEIVRRNASINEINAAILAEKMKQRQEEIRLTLELIEYGRRQADLRSEIQRIVGEHAGLAFGFGAQASARRLELAIRMQRDREILAGAIMPSQDLLDKVRSMFAERNRALQSQIMQTEARLADISRRQENIIAQHAGVLSIEPRTGMPVVEELMSQQSETADVIRHSAEQAARALALEQEIVSQQLAELREREGIVNALEEMHRNTIESNYASVELILAINDTARSIREMQLTTRHALRAARIGLDDIGLDARLRISDLMLTAARERWQSSRFVVPPEELFTAYVDRFALQLQKLSQDFLKYNNDLQKNRDIIFGRLRDLEALASSGFAGDFLDIEKKRIELAESIAQAQLNQIDITNKLTTVYADLYQNADNLVRSFNDLTEPMRQFNRGLAGALLSFSPADILGFAESHFRTMAVETLGRWLDEIMGVERIDQAEVLYSLFNVVQIDMLGYVQEISDTLNRIEFLLQKNAPPDIASMQSDIWAAAEAAAERTAEAVGVAGGSASAEGLTETSKLIKKYTGISDKGLESIKEALNKLGISREKIQSLGASIEATVSTVGAVYSIARTVSSVVGSFSQARSEIANIRKQVGWTVNPSKYARYVSGQIMSMIGLGALGRAGGPAALFGFGGGALGGAIGAMTLGASLGMFAGPVGAASGAVLGVLSGLLLGRKIFRAPTPPSRLRRGLQRVFDELGIPRIAQGGRGISFTGESGGGMPISDIVGDIGFATGQYLRYRYPGLGELHMLSPRIIASISNAARSLGLGSEDARKLADDVMSKLVPSFEQGIYGLLALNRSGKITFSDMIRSVSGLLRAFDDLPPAIDTARLSLVMFGGDSKVSVSSLRRAIEDARTLIAEALPNAFRSAAHSGSALSMLRDIGSAYADIFVNRVSERILQRKDIGEALTEAVELSSRAAEALAQGDTAGYRYYISSAMAAFRAGQAKIASVTGPMLPVLRGVYYQVGAGGLGFSDVAMQSAPVYAHAYTADIPRYSSYDSGLESSFSSRYLRDIAYEIKKLNYQIDSLGFYRRESSINASFEVNLDGRLIARSAHDAHRYQRTGVSKPNFVGLRR